MRDIYFIKFVLCFNPRQRKREKDIFQYILMREYVFFFSHFIDKSKIGRYEIIFKTIVFLNITNAEGAYE